MKIKILVYDTETTGLPLKWISAEEDLNNWGNIVQLGARLFEIDLDKIDEPNYGGIRDIYTIDTLVQPVRKGKEISIHPKAQAVHGFSVEDCYEKGNTLETVLFILQGMHMEADVAVCHNRNFDRNVYVSEMLNVGFKAKAKSGQKPFCTMEFTTPILKLEGKYGNYKFPKLEELYEYLFQKSMHETHEAHNALGDVNATVECLLELIRTQEPLLEWLQRERQSIN